MRVLRAEIRAAFLLLCPLFGRGGVFGQATRESFLKQYEPHATQLASLHARIKFRVISHASGGSGKEVVQTTSGMFDLHHVLARSEGLKIIDLKTQEVIRSSPGNGSDGGNPQYSFSVLDRGKGRFVLNRATLKAEDPNGPYSQSFWMNFPYAHHGKSKTYLDLIRDPTSTFHGAREVVWRGQKVVEVRLGYDYFFRNKKGHAKVAWYFLPSAGWVCVGTKSLDPDTTRPGYEFANTYDTSGEWAVPTRQELWQMHPNNPEKNKRMRLVEILEYAPATDWDESRFRLSAFGLPEPVGVKWEKPTPRWAWLLVATGGLLVLAAGFRLLARRRRVPAPIHLRGDMT